MPARLRALALLVLVVPVAALADEPEPKLATTIAVTGFNCAMRDQPDFGVGIASLDHPCLRGLGSQVRRPATA